MSTSTQQLTTTSTFATRSAKKAQRNLAIFKKVEIEKLTHEEVAARFRIHRSRVTQIVQQVRIQLAQAGSDDPHIESHLARQRLQREMEKLRLEYALDAAAQAMRRDAPVLVTNRAGSRDKGGQREGWSETVTRDKPPNVQSIKTFLRVARDLGELNEREIAENPIQTEKLTQFQFLRTIADLLRQWSDNAPSRADRPSDAFIRMVNEFTSNLCTWLNRYRMGASEVNAWPVPPPAPGRLDESPSSESGETEINHQPPETNIGLTSISGSGADTNPHCQTS